MKPARWQIPSEKSSGKKAKTKPNGGSGTNLAPATNSTEFHYGRKRTHGLPRLDFTEMITLSLTIEQAAMLAEAMELATTLAHRADDVDAFAYFNGTDLIYEQVPELSGSAYSEAYRRMDASIPRHKSEEQAILDCCYRHRDDLAGWAKAKLGFAGNVGGYEEPSEELKAAIKAHVDSMI